MNLRLGWSWVLRDTFIFTYDYAEVKGHEILQSYQDFITQRRFHSLKGKAC